MCCTEDKGKEKSDFFSPFPVPEKSNLLRFVSVMESRCARNSHRVRGEERESELELELEREPEMAEAKQGGGDVNRKQREKQAHRRRQHRHMGG